MGFKDHPRKPDGESLTLRMVESRTKAAETGGRFGPMLEAGAGIRPAFFGPTNSYQLLQSPAESDGSGRQADAIFEATLVQKVQNGIEPRMDSRRTTSIPTWHHTKWEFLQKSMKGPRTVISCS